MSSSTDVIAYTYEADVHCLSCTYKRFPILDEFSRDADAPDDLPEDDEGNEVSPVFESSEFEDCEVCGDCHSIIRESDEHEAIRECLETIRRDYKIENNIIRSPGKFEGEHLSSPWFHERIMNGEGEEFFSDDEDDPQLLETHLEVSPLERRMLNLDDDDLWAVLSEDSNGFVHCSLYSTKPADPSLPPPTPDGDIRIEASILSGLCSICPAEDEYRRGFLQFIHCEIDHNIRIQDAPTAVLILTATDGRILCEVRQECRSDLPSRQFLIRASLLQQMMTASPRSDVVIDLDDSTILCGGQNAVRIVSHDGLPEFPIDAIRKMWQGEMPESTTGKVLIGPAVLSKAMQALASILRDADPHSASLRLSSPEKPLEFSGHNVRMLVMPVVKTS